MKYYVLKKPLYTLFPKWSIDQELEEPEKANQRMLMLMAGGQYQVDIIVTDAPSPPDLGDRE